MNCNLTMQLLQCSWLLVFHCVTHSPKSNFQEDRNRQKNKDNQADQRKKQICNYSIVNIKILQVKENREESSWKQGDEVLTRRRSIIHLLLFQHFSRSLRQRIIFRGMILFCVLLYLLTRHLQETGWTPVFALLLWQ